MSNNLIMIEFPTTLNELEKVSSKIPKSEREFLKIAFKSLHKIIKKNDKIHSFLTADPKLTKTGFIVLTDKAIILISLHGGLRGKAETEIIKYKKIKSVDFDITKNILNKSFGNPGILHLTIKKILGKKKRKIRNIPEEHIDSLVQKIKEKI